MKAPFHHYFCLFFFLFSISAHAQYSRIFWIDQSYKKIQSAWLNGSHVTDITTDVQSAEGIAIDTSVTPMKIYYSEAGRSRIMRMNFDGSDPEEVVTGINGLEDLDLDLVNRKVFWLKNTFSDDRVQSADMDSLNGNVKDLYASGYAMHDFRGIGVDVASQAVFWSQSVYANYDRISRVGYNGSGRVIVGSFNYIHDIDVVGNMLYWIRGGGDLLVRTDRECSYVDTVLFNVNGRFFAMDTTLGMAFWTESKLDIGYSKIMRARLDNTDTREIVTGTGNYLSGIALYYNPDFDTSAEPEFAATNSFTLSQNYPNPFNPTTIIEFSLPNTEYITLKVYNILGKEITTLVSRKLNQGIHAYTFDGTSLASGIYFYALTAGDPSAGLSRAESTGSGQRFHQVRKMMLLK